MASAILFESRTIILATIQRNWQCISWRYIDSTKNSMLQDTQMSRSNMGAFRCIHTRNPSSPPWLNEVNVDLNGHCALIGYSHNRCDRIGCKIERALMPSHPFFIGPEHSTNTTDVTIDRCTGRSQGSARANRIICRISWESFANVKSTYECLTITTNALPSIRIYCDAYENNKNMLSWRILEPVPNIRNTT